MQAKLPQHRSLKEHSFTSQSVMLHKGVGIPDPATVHRAAESSYSSGHLSVCHRPRTECHIADRPPLPVLCVVFVITSLCEEAVQELELR